MMELIRVVEKNGKHLVSARELYQFLEPTERFSNWFDRQLKYGFEENEDYTGCKVFNTQAKQELQDYAITLNMAKEISMIQRSDNGKQARRYFIECEDRLKSQLPKLSKELQAIFALDQKTLEIETKVNDLENNMPLFNTECKELQTKVRKKAIEVLGGYKSKAYNNKSIRVKIFTDIQRQLKREFGVNRYESIKRIQLNKAYEMISNYKTPYILNAEIVLQNNQLDILP